MYFSICINENQDYNTVIQAFKKQCPEAEEYTCIVLRQDRLNTAILTCPDDPFFSSSFTVSNRCLLDDINYFLSNLEIGRKNKVICVFKITDSLMFSEFWNSLMAENTYAHQQFGTRQLARTIQSQSCCYLNDTFIDFTEWFQYMQDKPLAESKYHSLLSKPINKINIKGYIYQR